MSQQQFPVIIAGAGPCGLVAALTLQKEGMPFLVVERAAREKIASNVGSGFDLAPTAIDVLKNRLGLQTEKIFQTYAGMHLINMEGDVVNDLALEDVTQGGEPYEGVSVNRADLQNLLLDVLLKERTKEDETEILRCGVEVTGYHSKNDASDGVIAVSLSDGTTIMGRALLGCDGIHSAVRRHMLEGKDDPLHFCNTNCWWGKTEIEPGSNLEKAVAKTQKHRPKGCSFVWALGSHQHPGSFMTAPVGNTLIWAFFTKTDSPPGETDDLTRRGGKVLSKDAKQELEAAAINRGDLIRLAILETSASAITKVGLFDRENLDVPYVKGNVVLLGDAAHPQSPFMGQGVNMAIADAYVCATRLSMQRSAADALLACGTTKRRKGVNKVIGQARWYGDVCVSEGWFSSWLFQASMRWLPVSWVVGDMVSADQANADFVRALDEDLGLEAKE